MPVPLSPVTSTVESLSRRSSTTRKILCIAGERETIPWKADRDSPLLKIVKESYMVVLKKSPKVTGIHGGLECGVIAGLKHGMEIVSVGPTIKSPHSPSEYVEVSGVRALWELLKGISKRMPLL